MIKIGNSTGGSNRKLLVNLPPQSSDATRLVVQFGPRMITRSSRLRPPGGVGLKLGTLPRSIGGMRYSRQASAAAVLAFLCLGLTGCGISRDVGLAERCADIMRRAYPSAAIEITKSEASATSLTTIMARVDGVRTDMPRRRAAAARSGGRMPVRRECAHRVSLDGGTAALTALPRAGVRGLLSAIIETSERECAAAGEEKVQWI